MCPRQTSVPRWSAANPGIDRSGRSYIIMSFTSAAVPIASAWQDELVALGRPVRFHRHESATEHVVAALEDDLATAVVGLRLLIVGPQVDALLVHRTALREGMLDSEIVTVATDESRRRVWCAHCDVITSGPVDVGGILTCVGCRRALVVHHHVSRRRAAFMGYMADAEERA